MGNRRLRSLLWTSGLDGNKYNKAQEVGADISIIDFEDSVPLHLKEKARSTAIRYLKETKHVGIRINSLSTKSGLEDILFIIDNNLSLDLIVIPKVNFAEEIQLIDSIFFESNLKVQFCAIIETLQGLSHVHKIASASKNLTSIIFGAADLSSEFGIEITWEGLLYARHKITHAAAMAGIQAFDAPCFEIRDSIELEKQCIASKMLGFTGKAALHPSQVKIINDIFSPSLKEVAWAKKVLAMANGSVNQIAVVDNHMVGPPFITRAKSILNYFCLDEI